MPPVSSLVPTMTPKSPSPATHSPVPIMKMDDGDSVFKFDRSGPFFFISGNKDNCQKGQKLIVVVLAVRNQHKSPPVAISPASVGQTPASSPSPTKSSPLPAPATTPSPISHTPSSTSPSPTGSSPSLAPATTLILSPSLILTLRWQRHPSLHLR
ncbi:early nodulin-like protein 18 [Cornus florida]|uniref:early nodulin-like protein 18 n=1 Tax=Cornus florida TaxID=4283 RepID=UPI00289E6CBD|nr:early nodulin-like protein 18 [Cornus florida]